LPWTCVPALNNPGPMSPAQSSTARSCIHILLIQRCAIYGIRTGLVTAILPSSPQPGQRATIAIFGGDSQLPGDRLGEDHPRHANNSQTTS
jgi:hypothetical protein